MLRRNFIAGIVLLPQKEGLKMGTSTNTEPSFEAYAYEPKPDITLHELAQLLPVFSMADSSGRWSYLMDYVKAKPSLMRHFRKL